MGSTAAIGAIFGAKAAGSIAQGYSQYKAIDAFSDYQSSIYSTNAKLAAYKSADAVLRGEKTARKSQLSTRALIGSQRARLAAQGIDIESGSALDIQADTAALGAEDVLNIRNNAWREAWGYRVEAANLQGRANFTELEADFRKKSTILTTGMGVLEDAASFAYYANAQNPDFSITSFLPGGTKGSKSVPPVQVSEVRYR